MEIKNRNTMERNAKQSISHQEKSNAKKKRYNISFGEYETTIKGAIDLIGDQETLKNITSIYLYERK